MPTAKRHMCRGEMHDRKIKKSNLRQTGQDAYRVKRHMCRGKMHNRKNRNVQFDTGQGRKRHTAKMAVFRLKKKENQKVQFEMDRGKWYCAYVHGKCTNSIVILDTGRKYYLPWEPNLRVWRIIMYTLWNKCFRYFSRKERDIYHLTHKEAWQCPIWK